jgi:glycosyltransferase involved in cell wall biosynthesis
MPATDPSTTPPLVTVVVPMRNEAAGIVTCLESILAQELPAGSTLELLVLDGESTDRSAELVGGLAARDARVRLLPNPDRLQADAFNLGIGAARGRYLVRMDAHTSYAPDYVAESVRLLDQTGAENVGGVQRAEGRTWLSRAIAAAVSSRFAAGDAKYRHATEPAWVDTVYLGAWRTETLRRLGGMRPGWAVNEDYEMNVRLRKAGGRIYLSPTIRSSYLVRASLPKLIRQYCRYGFWKVRTLRAHPGSLRWRQLVAPAFVLGVVATPVLVHWFGAVGAAHLALYAAANLAASVITARRSHWANLPLLPLIFVAIHLSWGSGFLAGWCWWPFAARDGDVAPT